MACLRSGLATPSGFSCVHRTVFSCRHLLKVVEPVVVSLTVPVVDVLTRLHKVARVRRVPHQVTSLNTPTSLATAVAERCRMPSGLRCGERHADIATSELPLTTFPVRTAWTGKRPLGASCFHADVTELVAGSEPRSLAIRVVSVSKARRLSFLVDRRDQGATTTLTSDFRESVDLGLLADSVSRRPLCRTHPHGDIVTTSTDTKKVA